MKKSKKSEKALRPSQRKSLTEFTQSFGTHSDYAAKALRRKITSIILIILCILALIYIGYFITDVFLKISETPLEAVIKGSGILFGERQINLGFHTLHFIPNLS